MCLFILHYSINNYYVTVLHYVRRLERTSVDLHLTNTILID